MTLQCKIVLSGLKKLTNNTESSFSSMYNSTCFCLDDDDSRTFDYGRYVNEIDGIIDLLLQEGYLVPVSNTISFQLTQKGIHSKQFALQKVLFLLI